MQLGSIVHVGDELGKQDLQGIFRIRGCWVGIQPSSSAPTRQSLDACLAKVSSGMLIAFWSAKPLLVR